MLGRLAAIVLSGLVVLVGSGCDSGGSSSSGSSYTSGGAAFKSVSDALTGAEGMIDTSLAPSSVPGKVSTMTSGLSAKWEVSASYNNPKYDSTSCPSASSMITLKEYMGTQFDNSQKRCNGSYINIFGRLENAGGMLCIIMNSLNATTSAELASAADASVTFTSAVKSDLATKCPSMASSLNNESEIATDSTATLQFDAPAVTTTYDLKITIQPYNNVVFVKYGGTEINFAVNEDNTSGNQRTLVSYDTSSKILRAEYASKSKNSTYPMYIHRLYKDETNSLARIVSSIQSGFSANTDTTAANIETYVISGYPSSPTIGFSISLTSMGTLADGSHDACVNGDTGAITNDNPTVSSNAFNCGTTASSNKTTATFTGLSSIITSTSVSTPSTWWNLTTGSEILSWSTIDNMLTSGL